MNDKLIGLLGMLAGSMAAELYKKLAQGEDVIALKIEDLASPKILSKIVREMESLKAKEELKND